MAQGAASSHGTSTEWPEKPRFEIPKNPMDLLPFDVMHVAWLGGCNDQDNEDSTDNEQFAGELQALQPARERERGGERERAREREERKEKEKRRREKGEE